MKRLSISVAVFSAAMLAGSAAAQQQTSAAMSQAPDTSTTSATQGTPHALSSADRRRAAKLFLQASRLYEARQFEDALKKYQEASRLDPTVENYRLAVDVAQSHAVTALLQAAAQQRSQGDIAGARSTLSNALQLDPGNKAVLERLQQVAAFGTDLDSNQVARGAAPVFSGFEELGPSRGVRSFHLRSSQRQVIQQVFRAWGIEATVDESVRGNMVRFQMENASFAQAMEALRMLTDTFYVAVDAHRALVARDTRELRRQYMRNGVETLPLPGLTATEITDMASLARNVFLINQAAVDPTAATITLRGPEKSLAAFNATYNNLMQGRSEVLIDVQILQLAHSNARETGLQPMQQMTVFNVLAEAKTVIQQNQALVNQIIASGLAGPTDYAKILAILIASGQLSNSVLTSGWVEFGGNCNLSSTGSGKCSPWAFGAAPRPVSVNLSLNSSDSRELDDFRLRLQDGEEGTLKSGTRYPIQTSSYSSLGASIPNIPGLTGAGNSGALAGLLAGYSSTLPNIPQVQYEDLGLVLKARPRVLRSGDVALSVDMKISSLTGQSINGVPVLANRAYSGVITMPANRAVVIASEVEQNESRAISGTPGLSEIPGFNDVTDKNTQRNRATMLIILTPHVVRNPHGSGRTPMLPMDSAAGTP